MDQQTSSLVNEGTGVGTVLLEFDPRPLSLSGWAALDGEPTSDDEVVLYLRAGDAVLGTIRRDRPRVDAGRQNDEDARAVGFDVQDFGLRTFAQMTGIEEISIEAVAGPGISARIMLDAGPQSRACQPLGSRHKNSLGIRLSDAWVDGSRHLRLRFEAGAKAAKSVDVYQCVGSAPVNLAPDQSIGRLASLISVTLISPFAPVLLVFNGEDGSIDAIDFLPFPSLFRGGLHAAERVIAGGGADDIAETATLSCDLVQAWRARFENRSGAVATIRLDPSVESGLEPMFDDDLLAWIIGDLGVQVEIGGDAGTTPDFLAERLKRHSKPVSADGHVLHLPADCIPTIAALICRVPADPAQGAVAGSMGIIDRTSFEVWSVWNPPFVHALEKFQLAESKLFAPVLETPKEVGRKVGGREIALKWPLALAFREQPVRVTRQGPFEVASDCDGPLLRKGRGTQRCAVSVLVLHGRNSVNCDPLLESLAQQQGVDVRNLVICEADDRRPDQAATTMFENERTVVRVSGTAGRLEQILAARDSLTEDTVAIVDCATVLPDQRTLSTLAQMLDVPNVSSVGCLLRAATDAMTPICAGYSFAGIDLHGTPGISFSAIDPTVWNGPSTYPVVASPLSALVTRRSLLNEISAAGSSGARPEADDLLFGIQQMERGGINLCTTIVSAYAAGAGERLSSAALSIPYRLSIEELAKLAQGVTSMQRVA